LYTGNSVFEGIDMQKLEAVAALCAVASVSAGGFAYAWRAKSDVVRLMAKGYKNMVESALDSLIDGLFFDEA
jgi:secreted Zn-dependent insulinase-like peptidase